MRPQAGERALAIAAPYAAMVMEAMGAAVTRLDDGDLTSPTGAYDVVVCEGAVDPGAAGVDRGAGASGGRLGVVRARAAWSAGRCSTCAARPASARRDLFDCAPPIMAGFEPVSGFAF